MKSGVEFAVSNGLTLATASWSGELARQSFGRDTCPSCDGTFGLTALRAAAGWRLLSIDGAGEGGGPASRAWRMNDESRPDALPLFGPYFRVWSRHLRLDIRETARAPCSPTGIK